MLGATFKGIARPNPSADRCAKSNTDSPRRVGPVLDFATENKDPHFSTIPGPQYASWHRVALMELISRAGTIPRTATAFRICAAAEAC